MKIEFEFSEEGFSVLVNAFALKYNYQDVINGMPNPTSKAEFVQNVIESLMVQTVAEVELAKEQQNKQAQVFAAIKAKLKG